jgi:hypothetical protein
VGGEGGDGMNLLYTSQWTISLAFGDVSDCRWARRLQREGNRSAVEQLNCEARILRSKQCRQREDDM